MGQMIKLYTDGSWRTDKPSRAIWGYIITDPKGNEIIRARGDVPEYGMRQILGELSAVINGLKWAVAHKATVVEIHYDYEGIKGWYTGIWKTRNSYTKRYAEEITRIQKTGKILLRFVKEVAHTKGNIPVDTWVKEYGFGTKDNVIINNG